MSVVRLMVLLYFCQSGSKPPVLSAIQETNSVKLCTVRFRRSDETGSKLAQTGSKLGLKAAKVAEGPPEPSEIAQFPTFPTRPASGPTSACPEFRVGSYLP